MLELGNIIDMIGLSSITYSILVYGGASVIGLEMKVEIVEEDDDCYCLYSGNQFVKIPKNVKEIATEFEALDTYVLRYDGYEVSIATIGS